MAQYKDIFKIKHNNALPGKGKILISEPFLRNVYFQRSVILLVEHSPQGAMGFVLNKRTSLYVNDFLEGLEIIPSIPIYLGGPVASDRLFFIHSLGDAIPGSIPIDENLYFDGDFEALEHYITKGGNIKGKLKFFLGYSGWTENQLESEIEQNSWLVTKTAKHNILNSNGESFWKYAVGLVGGNYKTWINYPRDPILN